MPLAAVVAFQINPEIAPLTASETYTSAAYYANYAATYTSSLAASLPAMPANTLADLPSARLALADPATFAAALASWYYPAPPAAPASVATPTRKNLFQHLASVATKPIRAIKSRRAARKGAREAAVNAAVAA